MKTVKQKLVFTVIVCIIIIVLILAGYGIWVASAFLFKN